jgi:hypothetical protein
MAAVPSGTNVIPRQKATSQSNDMQDDVYFAFQVVNSKLNRILKVLGEEVMPALDELEVEVNRAVAAIERAKTKIDELIANGTVSQEQVSALASRLRSATDSLSTSVPPPTEPPAGEPEASQFRRR